MAIAKLFIQRSLPDQAVSAYPTPAKTAYLQVATTAHNQPKRPIFSG